MTTIQWFVAFMGLWLVVIVGAAICGIYRGLRDVRREFNVSWPEVLRAALAKAGRLEDR